MAAEIRTITSADIARCPVRSLSVRHYLPDGSCLHSLFEAYAPTGGQHFSRWRCESLLSKSKGRCQRQAKWISGKSSQGNDIVLCKAHRDRTIRQLEQGTAQEREKKGKMPKPM